MSPAKLSLSMVASPQSPLPFHLAKSLYIPAEPREHRWRCLPPTKLPLPASLFQLAIASRVNLGLSSSQHILRRHIADRAVQANGVVAIHVALNQAACIFQRERGQRPDTLLFERLVPALDFSVRLRIKR